jgi:MarR family transcriptional regulator, organic hydroperoxide resistance regulator
MFKPSVDLYDFVLRQTWHKVSRMYNQKTAHIDITSSIGFLLMIVEKAGTPSTQLGPRMGMEPTSLSRTLKTVEETGYIRRELDKIDKRKVLIFLTDKGVAKRRETRDLILDFNNKLNAKIPAGKMKIFFEVMERIEEITDFELEDIVKFEKELTYE